MSQLTSFRAGKLLSVAGALAALLVCTLLLTACTSGIDENSTSASLTIRPVTVAQNLNSGNGGQIDPTKSLPLAAGATSTPSRPVPTIVVTTVALATTQASATTAAGATTQAGATTAAGATTQAGSGATLTSAAGGTIELASKGDPAAGLRSFRLACQSCHANGGKSLGSAGQPILSTSAYTGNADTIRGFVRNGNKTMAALDKDTVPDADLENIIAYVQSIRTVK